MPKPLRIGRDKRGLVTRLDMNWLRNGRQKPMAQAEFAASSMELLAALHDDAKIMHLDLRLDNMVITADGVGFVDFGTSAQIDEDLTTRPVLNSLFMELMQTSEVQKVLSDMLARGEGHQRFTQRHRRQARSRNGHFLLGGANQPPPISTLNWSGWWITTPWATKPVRCTPCLPPCYAPKTLPCRNLKMHGDLLRGINRVQRRSAA